MLEADKRQNTSPAAEPAEVGRVYRVPTVVYNTLNYRVLGLCPSSGVLNKDTEHDIFGNWVCFRSQVTGRYNPSSQRQNYITNDIQSASLPWCQGTHLGPATKCSFFL
jgi:hypothetical protein